MILKTIGLFVFIVGLFILMVSLHNIDIAYNMIHLNASIDTNWVGKPKTSNEIYVEAYGSCYVGIIFLIIGFISQRF